MKFFTKIHQNKNNSARLGIICLSHGTVQTPAFVPVGTRATIKGLTQQELTQIRIQMMICNTYHLSLRPGGDLIQSLGGLHTFMGWDKPIMTDSGGFQIFSLARRHQPNKNKKQLIKIDNDGVTFTSHLDGSMHRFTPEISIQIQHQLGADLIVAFDDCATFPISYDNAKASLERTHHWAKRSLIQHKKLNGQSHQKIFGVIQGSIYQDLRCKSAEWISSLNFDAIAVGGVSVGESQKDMQNVLSWLDNKLPINLPRHLLGIGELEGIFWAIHYGIDTLDCIIPTRWARNGTLIIHPKTAQKENTKHPYRMIIRNECYASDSSPIDPLCHCQVCQNYSRSYLRHLFMVGEMLGPILATYHNLYFMENLFKKIRQSIQDNRLYELAQSYQVTLPS